MRAGEVKSRMQKEMLRNWDGARFRVFEGSGTSRQGQAVTKGLRPPSELSRCHIVFWTTFNTYDHRSVRTGHPVRSAIHKH